MTSSYKLNFSSKYYLDLILYEIDKGKTTVEDIHASTGIPKSIILRVVLIEMSSRSERVERIRANLADLSDLSGLEN